MSQNELPKATCMQCGHIWVKRVANPITCPECGSLYWNMPKIKRKKKLNEFDGMRLRIAGTQ